MAPALSAPIGRAARSDRDYLRIHPDEARRYGEVKRRLVALRPGDRLAYIEGKADSVAALEERAVMFARGREMP